MPQCEIACSARAATWEEIFIEIDGAFRWKDSALFWALRAVGRIGWTSSVEERSGIPKWGDCGVSWPCKRGGWRCFCVVQAATKLSIGQRSSKRRPNSWKKKPESLKNVMAAIVRSQTSKVEDRSGTTVRIRPIAILYILALAVLLQWIGTSPFPRGPENTIYADINDLLHWQR